MCKSTGTVPKVSSSSKSNSNSNTTALEGSAHQQQKTILQPIGVNNVANRCSPLNIVASIQQQQQQKTRQVQQQQHQQQPQQHKNTEVVAPIRRDLKDLNVSDYLKINASF